MAQIVEAVVPPEDPARSGEDQAARDGHAGNNQDLEDGGSG